MSELNVENVSKVEFPSWCKKLGIAGLIIGPIAFMATLYYSPERAWVNFLVNYFYFLSLALGGLFIFSLQNVVGSSWSRVFSRIPFHFSSFLKVNFILFIILLFGVHTLYEWSHAELVATDHLLQEKAPYLNMQGFAIRGFIILLIWMLISFTMKKYNKLQDLHAMPEHNSGLIRNSIFFLITFGLGYSVLSWDLIMSLEPHWFSTIFAVYTFSGAFVAALAATIFFILIFKEKGYFKAVNENHLHDLGKLLFGFATFWAYIWFSQYMLIWYSNIPEETAYYYLREHHTWDWLFYINFAVNWIVPFFALLPRSSKRANFTLLRVVVLVLIGRWLDIYLMVAPNVFKHAHIKNPSIDLPEVAIGIGFLALFFYFFEKSFKKTAAEPVNDPYYEESVHLNV